MPGRFQVVPSGNGVTVVVDYAHTDDALRNLIALARELVTATGPGNTPGRVITLFGCGGDRDRTKRPKMGRAAGEGSDLVILTSDNPRTEDPATILDEALRRRRSRPARAASSNPTAAPPSRSPSTPRSPETSFCSPARATKRSRFSPSGTMPFDDVAVAADIVKKL